jgi:hypothetical protein
MGGTAEVLPASRLRKRMAREVDVGERRAGAAEQSRRTIESSSIRGRNQRQTKGRPDQTGGVTRVLVASEPTRPNWVGVVVFVVGIALVAGRCGAAVG